MISDDITLAREYAASQSERAFASLVERHLGLVHSVALRSVGEPHLAEEVAQAVFIILARKAGTLGTNTILPGWLYQTTRHVADNALRERRRRERREQEIYMRSTLDESDPSMWQEIAPLLEPAMDALGEHDRNAVLLRFFQDKTLAEVGAATGVSEDAARVRINRALEKLRKFFRSRGVSATTLVIAGTMAAHSAPAAPAGLAKTMTAAAVAKGAGASASTLTLIKGALKIMAWTKAKTAIIAGVCALVAAGGSGVLIHQAAVRANSGVHVTGTWSAAFPRLKEPRYENMAFDVYTAGKRYFIATDQHLGPRRADYLMATSDGMDSFEMWVPPSWRQPGRLQPVFQQTPNYEQADSWARSGIFPAGQHACVQVLWLAFAFPFQNNITLQSATNIPLRLMADDDSVRPEDWIVEPQYWMSGKGKSLKRLRVYHPGRGKERGQPGEWAQVQSAYTNGWLKLEYECVEKTNTAGATLPCTFSYKEFIEAQHRDPTNRDDVDVTFIMTGQIAGLAADVPLPSEYPLIATEGHSPCGDFRILSINSQPTLVNLRDEGGFLRRGTPRFKAALSKAQGKHPLPSRP